ncbi:hypothetical protein AN958_10494 [Leucoagaricus sp. SymC.cos]|nr:hypothetical protein AN958_10494 [Leucoagaricus sp. SymC.cos]
MLSSRTKQISVYGKRSKRFVDASPPENATSDVRDKATRLPLIHRMKKRENGPAAVKYAINSRLHSPPRTLSLTKQRVMPSGSPTRQGVKRGTRLADILAQEATKGPGTPLDEKHHSRGKNHAPGTPSRAPLSNITTNTMNSPAISNVKVAMKVRKKTVSSPKILITSKTLSTVEMEIQVLDAKGQLVKREKRVTRTDVDDSSFELDLRPVRRSRAAAAQIIISDEEDDDESDYEETFDPPDLTSPGLLAQPSLKSLAQRQKSMALSSEKAAPALKLPEPSGLRVEVVVPPAPYGINRLLPSITSSSQGHRSRTIVKQNDTPHTSRSGIVTKQAPALLRYPSSTTAYRKSSNLIPSPPLKARQLTPIYRGQNDGSRGSNSLFAYGRGVLPSPSTPTDSDLDLSLELSQLDIGVAPEEFEALCQKDSASQPDYPGYLRPLLEECRQEECGPYEFSAFIESFPFDPILQDTRQRRRRSGEILTFKKIGEASYSEVFGIGGVVLKVIPLRDESRQRGMTEDEDDEGPAPTDAKDVRKEIIVTRAMGEVHDGFVKLLKTYVVRGKYPELLLNLWDEYNEKKGSESVRPDSFTVSQMYAIIVLSDDGPDLEAYTFSNAGKTGWRKAASLFWQVAKALAHAEKLVSFEHRDLHWGQVLVKDLKQSDKPPPLRSLTHTLNQSRNRTLSVRTERMFMDDLDHGVQATIIDLGLSRMDAGDGSEGENVHWTSLDEEVFMGEGDYQFDVYRLMKDHTGGNWEGYHPLTNVMWLHYLVTKLLRHKNLRAPSVPRKPRASTNIIPIDPQRILHNIKPSLVNPPQNTEFTEKDCHDTLVDVEEWLGRCIAEIVPVRKPKGKGRPRKTTAVASAGGYSGNAASSLMCSCAGQVVGYGVKRGWIRPDTL